MRLEALVVEEAKGQCREKKVEKHAAEGDDEPQGEQLAAPVVGGGGRGTCECEDAVVGCVEEIHGKGVRTTHAAGAGGCPRPKPYKPSTPPPPPNRLLVAAGEDDIHRKGRGGGFCEAMQLRDFTLLMRRRLLVAGGGKLVVAAAAAGSNAWPYVVGEGRVHCGTERRERRETRLEEEAVNDCVRRKAKVTELRLIG